MRAEYSPDMLRLFLRARCVHAVNSGICRDIKAARSSLRKLAGVTSAAFDVAWTGRLNKAAPRLKLWRACGVVLGDLGVILTDDGGQAGAGK